MTNETKSAGPKWPNDLCCYCHKRRPDDRAFRGGVSLGLYACRACVLDPSRDRSSDVRWEPIQRSEVEELFGPTEGPCQLPDCDEHAPEAEGYEAAYCGLCGFPHDEHENGECVSLAKSREGSPS